MLGKCFTLLLINGWYYMIAIDYLNNLNSRVIYIYIYIYIYISVCVCVCDGQLIKLFNIYTRADISSKYHQVPQNNCQS
jgi:hypothetical protein